MSVPTKHTPITNVSTTTQVVPARSERRTLTIQSYSGSTGSIWVAFGQDATAGNNGEWQVTPGATWTWNGLMPPLQGNVPLESINIIVSGGSATGAIIEQL